MINVQANFNEGGYFELSRKKSNWEGRLSVVNVLSLFVFLCDVGCLERCRRREGTPFFSSLVLAAYFGHCLDVFITQILSCLGYYLAFNTIAAGLIIRYIIIIYKQTVQ